MTARRNQTSTRAFHLAALARISRRLAQLSAPLSNDLGDVAETAERHRLPDGFATGL